jgi:hypothetical protein
VLTVILDEVKLFWVKNYSYYIYFFLLKAMIRTNKSQTNRGANGCWSMESLYLAVLAVKANTCGLNQAASNFGIQEQR